MGRSHLIVCYYIKKKGIKTILEKSNWPCSCEAPDSAVVRAATPACDRMPAWLRIKVLKRCNYRLSAGRLYEYETCHFEKPFK